MRDRLAGPLFVALLMFASLSFGLIVMISAQGRYLASTADLVRGSLGNVEDDRSRLERMDPARHRRLSAQAIAGKNVLLAGVADVADTVDTNVQRITTALGLSLAGLCISGLALHLRLRRRVPVSGQH